MGPMAAVDGTLFGGVVVGVVVVALLVALAAALASRDVYEHIGRGGLGPGGDPPAGSPDDGLAEEVRALAVARNARRRERGLEPVDVEAEVERRLREL
ncbi:MAG: hypothetical protein QOE44_411 [Solirubrobacteraceae bacterium]|nr:hypothetical protein [Solirubrobacteraceae bacterium]